MRTTLSSLNRGLQLLLALGRQPDGMTAAELADAVEIPLSTAYRYIRALADYGFVASEPNTGRHTLGNRLLSLAEHVPVRQELVRLSLPFLRELSRRFAETFILVQVSGLEALCLERVESRTTVRLSFEKGVVLPLHAGASARILMAYLDAARVDEVIEKVGLTRYTERTITDPAHLKRVLADVRDQGYAVSDEEYDRGVRAIAVPIFDAQGTAVAGLSCVGPAFRLDDDKTAAILDGMRTAAERIRGAWPKEGGETGGGVPHAPPAKAAEEAPATGRDPTEEGASIP